MGLLEKFTGLDKQLAQVGLKDKPYWLNLAFNNDQNRIFLTFVNGFHPTSRKTAIEYVTDCLLPALGELDEQGGRILSVTSLASGIDSNAHAATNGFLVIAEPREKSS